MEIITYFQCFAFRNVLSARCFFGCLNQHQRFFTKLKNSKWHQHIQPRDAIIYKIIILSHALIFLHFYVQWSICSKHIRFIHVFEYAFLVVWTTWNITASNYAFLRCRFLFKTCVLYDFINFHNTKNQSVSQTTVELVTYFWFVWFQNELLAREMDFCESTNTFFYKQLVFHVISFFYNMYAQSRNC